MIAEKGMEYTAHTRAPSSVYLRSNSVPIVNEQHLSVVLCVCVLRTIERANSPKCYDSNVSEFNFVCDSYEWQSPLTSSPTTTTVSVVYNTIT